MRSNLQNNLEIFGIPIAVVNIPDINLEEIINLVKNTPHNVGEYQTNAWSFEQQIFENKVFENILPFIKTQIQLFSLSCNHLCEEIKIINSWSNILPNNAPIAVHWHENSYISGTIHLDDKGTFLIKRPFSRDLFNIDIGTIQHDEAFEIPSKPGQLILFPSRVRHGVTVNTDSDRYSLAFNTMPVKFGEETKMFDWRRAL